MQRATLKSHYWAGFRAGLPFLLVIAPFAVLFGVVATEAGLDLVQTMTFSLVVIAGAAQFTAIQLMLDGTPTIMVILTALAVNMRMAMYSASIVPYLGAAPLWQRVIAAYFLVDQSYAVSISEFESKPQMTVPERMAYFFGALSPVCPLWYVFTLVGALVGTAIPDWMALDFAVPITFLAIVAPMLRTLAHVAAAATSVVLALILAGLPFSLGLMVAAVAAMVVGAAVESWSEARTAT